MLGLWLLIAFLVWLYALPGRINAWVRDPEREPLWPRTREFCALCALMTLPGLALVWDSLLLMVLSILVVIAIYPEREQKYEGNGRDPE